MSDSTTPEHLSASALDEFQTLWDHARRGDENVLRKLRAMLDANSSLWKTFGDLAAHVEEAWIQLTAGEDFVVRESLRRTSQTLRMDLAGASPSPIERLLVDRITATRLQVAQSDVYAVQTADASLKQAEFAMKRQDVAQKRHLAAIAALASYRKVMGLHATGEGPEWHEPRVMAQEPDQSQSAEVDSRVA